MDRENSHKPEERVSNRRPRVGSVTDLSTDAEMHACMERQVWNFEAGALNFYAEIEISIGVESCGDVFVTESFRDQNRAEVTAQAIWSVICGQTFSSLVG